MTSLLVAVLALPALLVIGVDRAFSSGSRRRGLSSSRQPRMGYRGQIFTFWKLRSMRIDVAATGKHFTEENDPRITRVGRFIRKYRIDELPQIWNIIRGRDELDRPQA